MSACSLRSARIAFYAICTSRCSNSCFRCCNCTVLCFDLAPVWHLTVHNICSLWGEGGGACRRRIVRVEEAMHTGGAASASVHGGRSGWTVEHRMCCQKTIASRTIGGCSCTGRENFRSFSEYLLVVFGFINYYALVSNICKYMCKCNIDIFLDACLIWSVTFRVLDTPYSCTLQSVSTHSTFHNIFSYSPYLKRLFLY